MTTTRAKFKPTHELYLTDTRDGQNYPAIPVHLVDGAAYTAEEWAAGASADWEWSPEAGWTFQGGYEFGPGRNLTVRALIKRIPEGSQYTSPGVRRAQEEV